MVQKVIQIGNSIGVIIPQSLAKNNLKVGDVVIIEKDSLSNTFYIFKKKKGVDSGISLEFFRWLKEFSDRHKDVLIELAKR